MLSANFIRIDFELFYLVEIKRHQFNERFYELEVRQRAEVWQLHCIDHTLCQTVETQASYQYCASDYLGGALYKRKRS